MVSDAKAQARSLERFIKRYCGTTFRMSDAHRDGTVVIRFRSEPAGASAMELTGIVVDALFQVPTVEWERTGDNLIRVNLNTVKDLT